MRHKPIVAFGDSITRGYPLPEGQSWVNHLSGILSDKLGERAPEVFNAGGNGNTTRDGLLRIQADVLEKQPGLVLVEFAGNDAGHNPVEYPDKHVTREEFERNLRTIDALVSQTGAQVVFMTFPPVIESQRWPGGAHPFFAPAGGPEALIATYRNTMRALARELGRPLFDLEHAVLGFMEAHGKDAIMAPDGVHLTVKCNELIAEALAPRVMEWLGEA